MVPPAPRWLGAPGRTSSRLVPMALMRSSTCCFAPLPTASIAITEPTPMTMPSSVSAVRKRLARSAARGRLGRLEQAGQRVKSSRFDRCGVALPASHCSGPGSLHDAPVGDLDDAVAPASATSRACVMRITVWPSRRELVQQRHHLRAALAVERAGGLVGEHDVAAVHERARDGHALLLAAGELARAVLRGARRGRAWRAARSARARRSAAGTPA